MALAARSTKRLVRKDKRIREVMRGNSLKVKKAGARLRRRGKAGASFARDLLRYFPLALVR
jgi:hypothetical protein